MKKIIFIVEKTNTGYCAYYEADKHLVCTVGGNMQELRKNMVEAINLSREEDGLPKVTEKHIIMRLDLAQFFEYYNVINSSALAKRIGMSQSLLSQYTNGNKVPSEKQVNRILTSIKELGKELTHLELIQ